MARLIGLRSLILATVNCIDPIRLCGKRLNRFLGLATQASTCHRFAVKNYANTSLTISPCTLVNRRWMPLW